MDANAANAAALSALGALLAIVTFLGGFASTRLHGAYRDALRDLRESERRLDAREAGHVDGRLDPELRWLAEVRDAVRDSRWRESATLMALLCVASVVLGIWALTERLPTLDVLSVLALIVSAVLVTALLVLHGSLVGSTLAATVPRSRLWGLLRLENVLADTHRATVRTRAAHRGWLRALAARHLLARPLARWRESRFRQAERQRTRAVIRLERWDGAHAVLDDLATAGVRPPPGYAEGMRGLIPLVTGGSRVGTPPRPADDAEWNRSLTDLTRAVELDEPRRLRWLSALAACAELRDDPAARESATRSTLATVAAARAGAFDLMRRGPAGLAGDRQDPLPNVAFVEPHRPQTWEDALRRAQETGAAPRLVASVLVRWADALVLDQAGTVVAVDPVIAPAVDAAVRIMGTLPERDVDDYLRVVRPGFAELGASGAQMSRLVPPRPVATRSAQRSAGATAAPAGASVSAGTGTAPPGTGPRHAAPPPPGATRSPGAAPPPGAAGPPGAPTAGTARPAGAPSSGRRP